MPIHTASLRLFLIAITLFIVGCSQSDRIDVEMITSAEIANFSTPESLVFASGQPTQEQVGLLAEAGIQHVISLRTEGELDWDESALVESAGMVFHSLPVSGRDGVTTANAQSLENLLASLDGQPVLLHCGSSNRVGALKAITALNSQGATVDQAVAEGQRWGLTGMEPMVREILTVNQSQ